MIQRQITHKAYGRGAQVAEKLLHEGTQSIKKGADFIVGANGITIPTSRSILESGFKNAGFPTFQTRSMGMGYILPNGNLVRIMEKNRYATLRASFTHRNDSPICPFTGKPIQIPRGFVGNTRQYVREHSHLELNP